MNTLIKDLRFGVRMLLNKPAMTLIAIVALALGIGASTAIFSVVNTVLLSALPYPNANRLVIVWENNRARGKDHNVISAANFFDWREQSHVFENMAGFYAARYNLTGLGEPEEATGMAVSTSLFDVLGNRPLIGRTFIEDDGVTGKDNVAVLSYGFWQKHFGGDRNVVGKTFALDGVKQTVIGVMPEGFDFFVKENAFVKRNPEFWLPIAFGPQSRIRRGRFMSSIGLLKPNVNLSQARADMDALGVRLEQQYPDFNKNWGITLVPLHEQISGELRPALIVLMVAVGFLMLIACANVANLLMARSVARQKEFAIRFALGAGRMRIIRQLLTESLLLGFAGCVVGLFFVRWGLQGLTAITPRDLLTLNSVSIDKRVLFFSLALSFLTSLIFGLLPAWRSSRPLSTETLKDGARGTVGARSHRALNWFVVAQIALSLMLLVGSGLMIKSLRRLQSVDPGFNPTNVITGAIQLPRSSYPQPQQKVDFFQHLLTNVRALPGIEDAAIGSAPPFTGIPAATNFTIAGQPPVAVADQPVTDVRVVDQHYFGVLGIPLLKGRNFSDREVVQESHVVIINEALARKHFGNDNPLGQRLTINMKDDPPPTEIVGVVGDVRSKSMDVPATPMVYWPHSELPGFPVMLVVKTKSEPTAFAAAIQREVLAIDKNQPVSEMRTMSSLMADTIARSRFASLMLTIFAALAFLLASVGIYGVMSYSVSQRTNEIGIRMALGATGQSVLTMILKRGLIMSACGVVLGLIGSLVLTRFLVSLLYGVSATDPVTFIVVSVALTAVALFASYLPARRAMRVDPLVALRYE